MVTNMLTSEINRELETARIYDMLQEMEDWFGAAYQFGIDVAFELDCMMHDWEQQNKREGWSDFFNEPAHAGVIY